MNIADMAVEMGRTRLVQVLGALAAVGVGLQFVRRTRRGAQPLRAGYPSV